MSLDSWQDNTKSSSPSSILHLCSAFNHMFPTKWTNGQLFSIKQARHRRQSLLNAIETFEAKSWSTRYSMASRLPKLDTSSPCPLGWDYGRRCPMPSKHRSTFLSLSWNKSHLGSHLAAKANVLLITQAISSGDTEPEDSAKICDKTSCHDSRTWWGLGNNGQALRERRSTRSKFPHDLVAFSSDVECFVQKSRSHFSLGRLAWYGWLIMTLFLGERNPEKLIIFSPGTLSRVE